MHQAWVRWALPSACCSQAALQEKPALSLPGHRGEPDTTSSMGCSIHLWRSWLTPYLTFPFLFIGNPSLLLSSTIGVLTSKPPNLGYCSLLDWRQQVSENFIRENYLTNDSSVLILQQFLQKPTGSGCRFLVRTLCRTISVMLFSVSTNLWLILTATVNGRGIK